MRVPYKCLRCGLVNPMGSTACMACGASLTGPVATPSSTPHALPGLTQAGPLTASGSAAQVTASSTGSTRPSSAAAGTPATASASGVSPLLRALGWRIIDGRVIHVEPVYMAIPDPAWGRLLLKIMVLGGAIYYYGPSILVGFAILLVLLWLGSRILPQGLLSGVAVQVISFLLTRSLVGPPASVPVRDVRLRDASGEEYLVRLKGHLISGSIAVGDEIVAEGRDRNGTLLFRRGFNKRIRTAIHVRTP